MVYLLNMLPKILNLNFLNKMKQYTKHIILVWVTLLSLNAVGQISIIGKWQVINQGDTGYFEFDKDGYATMIMGGEKAGGKYFLMDETPACVKYTIKKAGEVYNLNLYIISLASKDSSIINIAPGILKPIDNTHFLFNINFEHEEFGDLTEKELAALRPKDFTDMDETVTLTKVK